MKISQISQPITAKTLNESLTKKFGERINLEAFTLEKLQDTSNKLRTKVSQNYFNFMSNVILGFEPKERKQ